MAPLEHLLDHFPCCISLFISRNNPAVVEAGTPAFLIIRRVVSGYSRKVLGMTHRETSLPVRGLRKT